MRAKISYLFRSSSFVETVLSLIIIQVSLVSIQEYPDLFVSNTSEGDELSSIHFLLHIIGYPFGHACEIILQSVINLPFLCFICLVKERSLLAPSMRVFA